LDNSGEITFNEFLPLTLCMTELAKKESVAELFKLNVQDGSDSMPIGDMQSLLGHSNRSGEKRDQILSEKMWSEFVTDFGIEGKDSISFDDLWNNLPHNTG